MAKRSRSIATFLESFRRVSAAAVNNKAALPKEAQVFAADLAKRTETAQKLNSEQENLKGQLKKITSTLRSELKAAGKVQTKVIRLAEVTYGSNSPELVEFRGSGES